MQHCKRYHKMELRSELKGRQVTNIDLNSGNCLKREMETTNVFSNKVGFFSLFFNIFLKI